MERNNLRTNLGSFEITIKNKRNINKRYIRKNETKNKEKNKKRTEEE